jgi:hypothetical protein
MNHTLLEETLNKIRNRETNQDVSYISLSSELPPASVDSEFLPTSDVTNFFGPRPYKPLPLNNSVPCDLASRLEFELAFSVPIGPLPFYTPTSLSATVTLPGHVLSETFEEFIEEHPVLKLTVDQIIVELERIGVKIVTIFRPNKRISSKRARRLYRETMANASNVSVAAIFNEWSNRASYHPAIPSLAEYSPIFEPSRLSPILEDSLLEEFSPTFSPSSLFG